MTLNKSRIRDEKLLHAGSGGEVLHVHPKFFLDDFVELVQLYRLFALLCLRFEESAPYLIGEVIVVDGSIRNEFQ